MTLTGQPMRSRLPRSADRQTSSARWTSGGELSLCPNACSAGRGADCPLSCAPERRGLIRGRTGAQPVTYSSTGAASPGLCQGRRRALSWCLTHCRAACSAAPGTSYEETKP